MYTLSEIGDGWEGGGRRLRSTESNHEQAYLRSVYCKRRPAPSARGAAIEEATVDAFNVFLLLLIPLQYVSFSLLSDAFL